MNVVHESLLVGVIKLHSKEEEALKQRVIRSAEAALADHNYISAIDVLTRMGLLAPTHVEDWRNGRIDYLEQAIQANPKKISFSMAEFRRWAEAKGLRPGDTRYVRRTREGIQDLQFTSSGDPSIEQAYRAHFVSPAVSEHKREKLEERLAKPPQPVVFQNLRDSQCSECGAGLPRDGFLSMEGGQSLCLACARFDDLEYLPSGDAALTRRATKYSERTAVVVRFSRSRKRYERQGILVEPAALAKAELECTEDAAQRAAARARAADIRREQDREFVERMTAQLLVLFPRCPPGEARSIAAHTAVRSSGRVGRTPAGRNLEGHALTAAVAAAIRHNYTNYDELLAGGLDRALARACVADRVQEILAAWST